MIGGVSPSSPVAPVEGGAGPDGHDDPTAAAALFGDLVAQLLAPPAPVADSTTAEPPQPPAAGPTSVPTAAAGDRAAALATPNATVLPTVFAEAVPTSDAARQPGPPAAERSATPTREHRGRVHGPAGAPAPFAPPSEVVAPRPTDRARSTEASSEADAPVEPTTEAPPITTASAPDPSPAAITSEAPATEGAAATAPAPAPEPAPPLHEQVAVKVRALRLHEGDRHSITVDLHPAELGAVTLEVRVQDGRVDVTLRAERPGAAAALGDSLPDLADALGGHGFDVGDLDVAPRPPIDVDRWTPPPAPGQHELPSDQRRAPQRERRPDHPHPDLPADLLAFDALL